MRLGLSFIGVPLTGMYFFFSDIYLFLCEFQQFYCHVPRGSGEGDGAPLQCSCLENPMDRGAWWAAVHGVTKSRTWLSDFTFTFHFHALEKEMATHSSVIAWRIPGMGEPGGLPSVGSHRVGYNWSNLAAAAAAGFSSTWTMNFQMFKLVLEKAKEPEIKLPTSAGS